MEWDAWMDELEIEFRFIRAGGYIERAGRIHGKGRFHHYRRAMSLLWPEDDHHRWSDLMLRRKCEEDILVMLGAGDTNKTYSASRYVMVDYWAHPDNTLWLTSSTDERGAQLRIWGKMKELFNRARDRYPWLRGRVLESRLCITPEEISGGEEGRLLTKGIIYIPCKRAENWVGLGAYAGIKPTRNGRLGHAGDEVSFMHRSFLQAYSNWYGKPNFQGILTGNITDIEDPLGVAACPAEGWDSWQDTKKTQEWRSRFYNAWVIAFDGRDSPNFDYPAHEPIRFPYLIGRKKIEGVTRAEGPDSDLMWIQCIGKPKKGAEQRRVINFELCERCLAFEKVVWAGGQVTEILALDAAYGGEGGDRCVLIRLQFGLEDHGANVIAVHPPKIVPFKSGGPPPEDQITSYCRDYAEEHSVPPSHFFFDGRAKLASAMGRLWSTEVNVVDFGGPATERPVSADEYIEDPVTKVRRLKRCDEHYSKFVTELWFSVRYVILSRQMRQLPKEVAEEGCKRKYRYTKGNPPRIEVETKLEMKERTTYSPDYFDGLVTGVEGARRLGFEIRTMREGKSGDQSEDWLEKEYAKHQKFLKKHELKPV